jgi:ABC-type branched-subunit amino acid transport system substrate-binding protein
MTGTYNKNPCEDTTVTANRRPDGAGSRARHPFQARARLLTAVIAALAAVLLAAGCSSSSSSSTAATAPASAAATAASGTTAASPAGSAGPGTDIGLTATTIKVGMIADVDTSLAPGLFQKSVNAVKAWADIVNANGGLAGRKVVVDFCDSKLDPNATTNCVINACQNDFALVGTSANALEDLSDIDGCKNAAGKAIGIPDLAAFAFLPLACDPDTYLIGGYGPYCATAKENPQTYLANIGDARYYTSQFKNLHGVFVYDSDVPTLKTDFLPNFAGDEDLGIKADAQGAYAESGSAPQSALTPVISAIKAAGSTYVYAGSTPQNTILLEREAKLQGVSSVKVWACNSGCYDSSFYEQGGSVVNGTYAQLDDLPFYTEYADNPALAALVKQMGGTSNLNNNAVLSYVMCLLFQDAVAKATANGGTLDRQTLFTALNGESSFNADGIIGPTNVGGHQLSNCDVITQLVNGQWQRVYPTKPGTFDCNSGNTKTIKLNVTL